MLMLLLDIALLAGVAYQTCAAKATCSATGDPHYKTFDGRTIHFQGQCKYVLAKDINNKFTVLGKNKLCGNKVTCTSEVTVKVKGLEIVIQRGGTVTVFGIVKNLPYNNRGVATAKHGSKVEVTTDVGLTVTYDCVYNVYITVSSQYRGKTRGICGNYNGNRNDLLKSDNTVTGNDQEFANSWKVDRSCPNGPPPINPCRSAGAHAQQAKAKCGLLRGHPFSACHNHVKVDSGFIQDCEYDVCACKDHPVSCLCEEYDAYVTMCGYAGVTISWKHLAQFSQCGSPCSSGPCLNGGVCTNQGRNFKCTCRQGYHGDRCQNRDVAVCQNANRWSSFDRTGWSKCPTTFPYIKGLFRNKAARPTNDWIYLLEEAKCCNNGNSNAECVQANWVKSFDRNRHWNLCPTGYFLSGLYRSHGHNLHNIEHAWCCKPRGASNSYKSCYNENVWSRFDWNRKGMVTCTRSGYYITGLYRSTCDYMYCIEEFKCCQL